MFRGARRVAAHALVGGLSVGCSGGGEPRAPDANGGPRVEPDYWPTLDWRTADPADHGFDAEELAEVERTVAENYTSVRSILVVREGSVVYERYWQGLDASDGHDVRSVTKSVVGALVGSRWPTERSTAWTRPSVSCWATTSLAKPTRAWPT